MSQSIAALLAQAELPGSDTPRLDAELLLAHVVGQPRSYLFTWPDQSVPEAEVARFSALLARRCSGEPVAYLPGGQGCWALDLQVSPGALIPRPDTGRRVELAVARGPGPA